jgi:hypothetical protein
MMINQCAHYKGLFFCPFLPIELDQVPVFTLSLWVPRPYNLSVFEPIHFNPEGGGTMLLWNISIHPQIYMVSQTGRAQSHWNLIYMRYWKFWKLLSLGMCHHIVTLKVEIAGSSTILAAVFQTRICHISEDGNIHGHCSEHLRSHCWKYV